MRVKAKIKTDRQIANETRNYAIVKPGFYTAAVRKMEAVSFRGKFGSFINEKSDDNLWEYLKILPVVMLLNDVHTYISRQDFIVGVIQDGELVRPDGDTEKFPVFGGHTGAQFMLQSLDMFEETEDGYSLDFNPEAIVDRVLRVRVGIGGYVKGANNYHPADLMTLLGEISDEEITIDNILKWVRAWNVQQDYVDEHGNEINEGISLKVKNVIIGWYTMSPEQAKREDFFVDGEAIYLNEEAQVIAQSILDEDGDDVVPW
ncbi:hypothetical protein LCGC14_0702670 [marine sediment metagenome]|uniref:Uncharacterized protein n=1 Tax=marine sediment metagenome TaxID=412755 RepID=A0A0F9T375_9ZZZZ